MNAKHIFSIITLLVVILTLLLVLTNFDSPAALAKDTSAVTLQQATPTPQVEIGSEIGSTDGILIMGVVIVLIVTVPLIFQKRK